MVHLTRIATIAVAFVAGFGLGVATAAGPQTEDAASKPIGVSDTASEPVGASDTASAIFAGGCFWCVEADFDKVDGVISTTSGYTGGTTENPTYKAVTYGDTGHYEAVRVVYDPARVDYRTLVDHFFRHVDPTDAGGQFCDRGDSYRTAVFVADEVQRAAAEAELEEVKEALSDEVVTPILPAAAFHDAEAYHQDYYLRNAYRYKYYRWSCGRDARIEEVWKDAAPDS